MGTYWTVKWVNEGGASPESLISRIEHVIARVIDEMSTWQENAFISRFNSAPANSDFALPVCFAQVLECAMQLAADTDGAFDPTVGPLVNLWGFGPDRPITEPPAQTDIAAAQTLCGWRRIIVKEGYICQPGGLYLDFSGIAKGYSVDLIADSLRGQGVRNFLVEVGGELSGSGIKPDGQPWWVALETTELQGQVQQSIVALTTLRMPGGRPASSISSARRIGTPGSRSDGLRMKALPQAIAGANFHIGIIAGKLKGVMPAAIPSGWRIE